MCMSGNAPVFEQQCMHVQVAMHACFEQQCTRDHVVRHECSSIGTLMGLRHVVISTIANLPSYTYISVSQF